MSRRNPRKDPVPGDVVEAQIGDGPLWNHHRVHAVENGIVRYWDEGLIDYVPIERWRKWYVGRRNVRVTPAKPANREGE